MKLFESPGLTDQPSQSISVEALEKRMRKILSKYTEVEKHVYNETIGDSKDKTLICDDLSHEVRLLLLLFSVLRCKIMFSPFQGDFLTFCRIS